MWHGHQPTNHPIITNPHEQQIKFLIMPAKPFKHIQLHPEQPDCCNECPLLGLIPEAEREFGSQETLVCLGTRHALNARIARSRKSEHTPKHPLKRWCDDEWERWQEEPYFGKLPVRKIDVSRYRDPWERSQQLPIIFHSKRVFSLCRKKIYNFFCEIAKNTRSKRGKNVH